MLQYYSCTLYVGVSMYFSFLFGGWSLYEGSCQEWCNIQQMTTVPCTSFCTSDSIFGNSHLGNPDVRKVQKRTWTDSKKCSQLPLGCISTYPRPPSMYAYRCMYMCSMHIQIYIDILVHICFGFLRVFITRFMSAIPPLKPRSM